MIREIMKDLFQDLSYLAKLNENLIYERKISFIYKHRKNRLHNRLIAFNKYIILVWHLLGGILFIFRESTV